MKKYDVASIVAINELENDEYIKISAAKQREIFGFVICGRKSINFDSTNQGTVRVAKWSDGSGMAMRSYTYEEFAQCINNHEIVEAW